MWLVTYILDSSAITNKTNYLDYQKTRCRAQLELEKLFVICFPTFFISHLLPDSLKATGTLYLLACQMVIEYSDSYMVTLTQFTLLFLEYIFAVYQPVVAKHSILF